MTINVFGHSKTANSDVGVSSTAIANLQAEVNDLSSLVNNMGSLVNAINNSQTNTTNSLSNINTTLVANSNRLQTLEAKVTKHGSWTPTINSLLNVNASQSFAAVGSWCQVGKVVTICGYYNIKFTATVTLAANNNNSSTFSMSLPSGVNVDTTLFNINAKNNVGGHVVSYYAGYSFLGYPYVDPNGNKLRVQFESTP